MNSHLWRVGHNAAYTQPTSGLAHLGSTSSWPAAAQHHQHPAKQCCDLRSMMRCRHKEWETRNEKWATLLWHICTPLSFIPIPISTFPCWKWHENPLQIYLAASLGLILIHCVHVHLWMIHVCANTWRAPPPVSSLQSQVFSLQTPHSLSSTWLRFTHSWECFHLMIIVCGLLVSRVPQLASVSSEWILVHCLSHFVPWVRFARIMVVIHELQLAL